MSRHHYIPKFYLKKFKHRVSPNRKRFFVHCYEKNSDAKIVMSKEVSTICWEEGFYTTNPEDPEAFEQIYLNKVDNFFASLLRKVVKSENIYYLTQRERLILCEFIFFTRWRSKAQKKEFEKVGKGIFKNLTELELKGVHKRLLLTDNFLTEKERKSIRPLWKTLGIQTAYDCVLDDRVQLIVNKTEFPFITSDNPLVIRGIKYVNREWFYFPLSPKILIIFYPIMLKDSISTLATSEFVHEVNKKILNLSDEIVISNKKGYLESLVSSTFKLLKY